MSDRSIPRLFGGLTRRQSDNFVLNMFPFCTEAEATNLRKARRARNGTSPLLRLAWSTALLSLFLASSSLHSQQKPGAGAQVHTGSSTGLDTDVRLMNMLADHQFIRLEAELDPLPPWQAQYYRGILANRSNDLKKSVAMLEPLVESISANGNVLREKVLRKTLAEDYLRMGDWAKAAAAYEALETRVGSKLTADEQDEIEMEVKMTPLVRDHPAMTADPCAPFVVTITK